ncbi:hypothetical protein CEUSTIGMA_g3952.t1 [Chlamydomonas eustigma]|uniref:Uncharacterized protein n=1 Tax=Chlamydomonas eustigma TaxID=1157962 RepID=A0A250X0A6_9CHLO|nr:hypothetical protein CEUSTIGMA_g3952.t1 [Chlamydomonas eustigma]|eukprot:GAX76507.1 hypothetical protein CEUSTIGMA_g3952.t1 [Chlamydomonas eustigma]
MLHSGKVEDSSDSQSPDYRMQQAQTSQRPQQVPRLCLTSRHLGEGIATHHPPSAHSALPVAAVDQGAASQPVVKAVVLTSDHASDSLKGNQTLTDILNLASTPKGLSKLSYQSDSAGSLHKTSTVLHVSDSPVAASPQNSSSGRSLLSRGSGSGTAVAAARDAVAAAASEMLTARDIELGVLQTERQDINLIGDQRVVPSAHTPHGLKLGMTDLASSSSYQGPQLSRFATQDAQATGVAMLSQIHEKGASSEDAVEPLTAAELQPSLGTGLQIEVYTAPAGEGMKVEDAEEDLVGLSGSSITNIEAMVMSLKSLPSRKSQAGRAP